MTGLSITGTGLAVIKPQASGVYTNGLTATDGLPLTARSNGVLPASGLVYRGSGLSYAFTPADLGASLLAFWNGSRTDLQTDDGGGLISSWRDTVAGYELTAAGTARPTYNANGFIYGNGTTNVMTLAPVPAAIPIGATACEAWFLVDQQALVADTANKMLGGWGGTTAANSRRLVRVVAGGVNRARITDTGTNLNNTSVDFSGQHVVRLIATGTTVNIEVDDVAAAGAAQISAITNPRIRLFADTAATAAAFALAGIRYFAITLPLSATQAAQMFAFFNRPRIAS